VEDDHDLMMIMMTMMIMITTVIIYGQRVTHRCVALHRSSCVRNCHSQYASVDIARRTYDGSIGEKF